MPLPDQPLQPPDARSILPLVVSSGCCIGCGSCAASSGGALTMRLSRHGMYEPVGMQGLTVAEALEPLGDALDKVCPFSATASSEDELAARFGAGPRHTAVGRYEGIWAGHVSEADYRDRGSSGGMTTWVLAEALSLGMVDYVIHVRSVTEGNVERYSEYTVSTTQEEVREQSGTRYHVQTLEEVVATMRMCTGRYALVGVPCFIKAMRLLAASDALIDERLVFTVALVCGHLKSVNYTTYLGWSSGVKPHRLADLNYRYKVKGRPANRYSIQGTSVDGMTVTASVEQIPMSDWGLGLFKPQACDYCDDVLGETADITCGDAWLPPFMSDWQGANLVVARSAAGRDVIVRGIQDGRLDLIEWDAEQAAASQEAGLRHRRVGLAVRLANRAATGEYAPPKRVAPDYAAVDSAFGRKMLLREQISKSSHEAFAVALERGSLSYFVKSMRPLVNRYYGNRSLTLIRRMANWVFYRLPSPAERFIRKVTRGRRFT